MSADSSVTVWIDRLKAGDPSATTPLWHAYFRRLVDLARQRLRGLSGAVADEEDVALSAFDSFFQGAAEGRFPRLEDRDDLWQLLLLITGRKAANLRKHERREKRGGGRVIAASAIALDDEEADAFAEVMGREPTPELAAQAAEECQRLLAGLRDPQLRQVALWKLEGYQNEEIAAKLGRSLPTVERKLRRIRELWNPEAGEPA
jgi:DNA-directed RNA polymerase specialized sigma24 family protein